MTEHKTLAAALAAFQAAMPVVPKNKTASIPTKAGGSYSYKYADLADLTNMVTPLLSSHGLSFSCAPRPLDGGAWEIAGVLLHTSGEKLEGSLPLHGRTPQEIGSSLTYMRRYLLGCLTGVVTDDDDDAQAANEAKRVAAKDWDAVLSLGAVMNDMTALRDLWDREGVEAAPAHVRERFGELINTLRVRTTFPDLAPGVAIREAGE